MKKKPVVSIIMGSDSDFRVMSEAGRTLDKLGIAHEVRILSAHRSPAETVDFAVSARRKGLKVIIAGAAGAAHLAGTVAANTTLPVIGVPLDSSFDGMDSLFSTVQMPAGVPVATVSTGKAGAVNAAILAAQIIGTRDKAVERKLDGLKKELVRKVKKKNRALKSGKA